MTITKKDTIILAVLLNLVVLVGVFVTARQVLSSEEKKNHMNSSFGAEPLKEDVEDVSPEESVAFDEIDQLLEEYDAKPKASDKVTTQPEKKKEKKVVSQDAKLKDGFYIVRPGDNPWKVAKKFHISFEKLLELNNLDETKAKNLKVGQTLRIKESKE